MPAYSLWICISILTALKKNRCASTLSRSTISAYQIANKRPNKEEEKKVTLAAIKEIYTEVLEEYVEVFGLADDIPESFRLAYAQELEKAKLYKDYANVVCAFKLQSQINMKELLTQLIVTNSMIHAKNLVKHSKEHQRLLIGLLCSNEYCKKAAAFIRDFSFSIKDFPHLIVRLQKKTVRYYINMIFFQKPPEQISLNQVIELFADYKSIQILLVEDMLFHKRYSEAWIVLSHFSLWSYFDAKRIGTVKAMVQHSEALIKSFEDSNVDIYGPITPGAFKMPCACEDIVLVEDSKGIEKAKELLNAQIIGIDSEWRPALMTFVGVKPTILQIASEKFFAIFDLIKLDGNVEFNDLIKNLLMSMSILKLGLGLKEDMRLICLNYPKMLCFRHVFNFIDISEFYKDKNPHEKQSSLAVITERVLNINLCKKRQMSNWNRRPLLKSQLHYAIADAYVLILAYKKLAEGMGEEEKDMQLGSINHTEVPEEVGEEESVVKTVETAELFDPDIIKQAKNVPDISIKNPY